MDIKPPFALPPRERRFTPGLVEFRAAAGDTPKRMSGYAAKFGVRSENLGYGDVQFYEIIEPAAFNDAIEDDVRGLFNHDANLILGRNKSKTLRLAVDATGLAYDIFPGEQSYARDLEISMARGDVNQSSFAFSMPSDYSGERWVREGKVVTRYIKKVSRLYDVSPVTYPAYPDTNVGLRSLVDAYDQAVRSGAIPNEPGIIDPAIVHAHRARALDLAERE